VTSPARLLPAVLLAAVLPLATLDAQPRATLSGAATSTASQAGAWSLPDPESLISKALARIIAQDRPAGIPMTQYATRQFGRDASIEAVRRFRGTVVSDNAFDAVSGWPVTPTLDATPCTAVGGAGCEAPTALWLAVSKLERGPLGHEIHLFYTTSFTAPPALEGQAPQANTYTFCERWLRTGGTWRYDGFVRVDSR